MTRKEEIKNAYKNLGKAHGFYDGMITATTFLGTAVSKLVWNMGREEDLEYQSRVFSSIPSDFCGRLLEVPVGTGVLSMPIFKTLPEADITCLDYSEKMMEAARKRAEEMVIRNISFSQGDVGALPFEDESFDVVLSLNGFHAFPNKEAAYSETYRVLKPGGLFCGCFYVKGNNSRTDFMIRKFYIKAGYFSEPFETMDSLKERLSKMYDSLEVSNVESIAVFKGYRKQ